MKIQFKISSYQLDFVNEILARILSINRFEGSMDNKSAYCLTTEVANKLLKKSIDKRLDSKPFKIALKYYEAHVLHQALLIYIDHNSTAERVRVIREVLAEINQKII